MEIPIYNTWSSAAYFFEPFPSEVLYTAADVYQCDPDSYAHGIVLTEEEEAYYADDIRRLNRSDVCDKVILYPGVEYLACSSMSDHWLPQEESHLLVNKYRDWALELKFDDWGIKGFERWYNRFGDYTQHEKSVESDQPFFIWRWEDVQNDPQLLDYWKKAMEAAYINVRTYTVTLTDDVAGVPAFHLNGAYLKEGRAITAEEYKSGAKVCMVSAKQAAYQGWKIGDKLDMSFFESEGLTYRFGEYLDESYPVYHQYVDGFFDQSEYEIVGIYSQRELSGNSEISTSVLTLPWATIFIPEKSVQDTTPESELPVHGNLLTIWLENGSIDRFLAQMDELGLTEYQEDRYNPQFTFYDQGYSIVQTSLRAMNSTAKLLLILSLAFLLVVSALLAYFFAQNQKQSVGILRMLGGSKKQALCGVLVCCLLLSAAGAFLGAILGHSLCGIAGISILNSQTEEQAVTNVMAQGDLARQNDEILWLDGFGPECLEGAEAVCLLPAYLGHQPGDQVPVVLQPRHIQKESNHLVTMLQVVGVYPDSLSSGADLILPIGHYEELCNQKKWQLYIHNMDFTAADNRTLLALKKALLELGLGAEESAVRVSIDDRVFEGTAAPVRSNLRLLENLYRFFFAAVIAIGFFLCFLLARGRKPEYAVMRLLGESTAQVTVKALLEQFILCLLGILLGAVLLRIAGQGSANATTCGIILVCYTLGAAMAVLLTVRVNVMDILRDKE